MAEHDEPLGEVGLPHGKRGLHSTVLGWRMADASAWCRRRQWRCRRCRDRGKVTLLRGAIVDCPDCASGALANNSKGGNQ